MIIPAPWSVPAFAEALRPALAAHAVRSVVLPGVVPAAAARALRARIAPHLAPFCIADRAQDQRASLRIPEADRAVRAFAASVCGRKLRVAQVRYHRLRNGDYSLFLDDALSRKARGSSVEVTIDLSAGECSAGEVVYLASAGPSQSELVVPQLRGAIALVERPAASARRTRYLTHTAGRADVWRGVWELIPV